MSTLRKPASCWQPLDPPQTSVGLPFSSKGQSEKKVVFNIGDTKAATTMGNLPKGPDSSHLFGGNRGYFSL